MTPVVLGMHASRVQSGSLMEIVSAEVVMPATNVAQGLNYPPLSACPSASFDPAILTGQST